MEENEDVLSKDQQEKVFSWFESKWPKEKRCCELCGRENWSTPEYITAPLIYSKSGEIKLEGNTFPQIGLVCGNCGNTKFFNAVIMGIVEGKNKREDW